MLAELLGLPHVGSVDQARVGDGKVTAHREIEGAHEVVECALPAVFTAQKGLNEPRYASLKGIMAAKKKPIAGRRSRSSASTRGRPGAGQRRGGAKLELPPARQAVKLVPGGRSRAAGKELVRLLREEAKVI